MSRDRLLAWTVLAATILIWAGFLITTRAAAVSTSLGPIEVEMMRFGTATILFAPVLLRDGVLPGVAGWRDVVLIAGFGGFGFILLLSSGLRYAPVSDAGIFTPSMLPIYVAILSAIVLHERFGRNRVIGFALILLGALAAGGWEAIHASDGDTWRGHLLFTAAATAWAIHTVAYRASGLSPLHAAALLCFWSALGFVALAAVLGTRFDETPGETAALQVVMRGVLSGFTATFTYGCAIAKLGASQTAAFAALVPILAALGAWVLLGETLSPVKAAGVLVVAMVVALASRPALAERVAKKTPDAV